MSSNSAPQRDSLVCFLCAIRKYVQRMIVNSQKRFQCLLLIASVFAFLLSTASLNLQAAYAQIVVPHRLIMCGAGNGGNGGLANHGSSGANGTAGGGCVNGPRGGDAASGGQNDSPGGPGGNVFL